MKEVIEMDEAVCETDFYHEYELCDQIVVGVAIHIFIDQSEVWELSRDQRWRVWASSNNCECVVTAVSVQ